MAKWVKSYPEAADRFAVSIADADSPSGFSWASKTIAEVKSALGISGNILYMFATFTNIGDSFFLESVNSIYNPSSQSYTLARISTGLYRLTVTGFGNFTLGAADVVIIPVTNSIKNGLPENYTMTYTLYNGYVDIKFYNSSVLDDIPANSNLSVAITLRNFS